MKCIETARLDSVTNSSDSPDVKFNTVHVKVGVVSFVFLHRYFTFSVVFSKVQCFRSRGIK